VAAGYADVAIEFAKGFATYDILAGFYIGLKSGLTILDLSGELPAVLRGGKACLLPYRLNELTRKINPLKLKEYLASGKPVVSSPLPEARKLVPHLRIAESVDEWVKSLRDAVSGRWVPDAGAVLECLGPHTWERKAEEFLRFCEAA
jgi:glycosyltransferase involved in cell wall biosynthesis